MTPDTGDAASAPPASAGGAVASAAREYEGPFAGAGVALYRRSVVPAGPAWARLALIHGYGDHGGRYLHLFRWLARWGVACHAADLRGQGKARGRRGFVRRWEEYLDDLSAFLSPGALGSETGGAPPLFLLGHSHGGLVVTAAAIRRLPALGGTRGLILSSPFFRNAMKVPARQVFMAKLLNPVLPWLRFKSGVRAQWLCRDDEMLREGRADPLAARVATPRWYLGHLRVQREVLARAAAFDKPLLMLLGEADPIADPAAGRDFFRRAGAADKTLRAYPGLLHEILREPTRERIFEDVAAWMAGRAKS